MRFAALLVECCQQLTELSLASEWEGATKIARDLLAMFPSSPGCSVVRWCIPAHYAATNAGDMLRCVTLLKPFDLFAAAAFRQSAFLDECTAEMESRRF